MCFVGMDMLGNHAMLLNSSSELRASHDNSTFMVSREDEVKGEEKRPTFLTVKFSCSQCYGMVS